MLDIIYDLINIADDVLLVKGIGSNYSAAGRHLHGDEHSNLNYCLYVVIEVFELPHVIFRDSHLVVISCTRSLACIMMPAHRRRTVMPWFSMKCSITHVRTIRRVAYFQVQKCS